MDSAGTGATSEQPLIVGIALPRNARARLAELLDGSSPVLLVSTAAQACALLDTAERAGPGRAETGRDPALWSNRNGRSPGGPADEPSVIELADTRIDSDLLTATVGERHVALTPLEHDLLVCLGAKPRRTWTHAALHEAVWNSGHAGGTADLHSVVKRLRRKLATLGALTSIDAVRGVGFRLGEAPTRGAMVRQIRRVDGVAAGRRHR
ncbi:MAG: winged helix-turn-helix domain-containing protein [Jiangellaceae bacterium]